MQKLSRKVAEDFIFFDLEQRGDRGWYVHLADYEDARIYFSTKTDALVFTMENYDLLEWPE